MKSLAVIPVVILTAYAHSEHRRHEGEHHARQVISSGSSSSHSSSDSIVPLPGVTSRSGLSSGTGLLTPSFSFSLASTNPTAVPLASITSDMSRQPTIPLDSTVPAGATPSVVVGAPRLPDPSKIVVSEYPEMDRIPPTDSAQVKEWLQEINESGIAIRPLEPTLPGGCLANEAFAADASRCWWTCGGCTSEDDISECNEPNHWGLTFDDGPGNYTANLLQYLDQENLKATFFVVGSRVLSFPHTLQTQYVGGHQIAVHTWSHKALTTLTTEEVVAELGWTKKVIRDTLGVTPTHFRPPFGDIDNRVRDIAKAMGLTAVMWTRAPSGLAFNTQDFDINGGTATVQQVLFNWKSILGSLPSLSKGFIVLEHDLFQAAIDVATGYILPDGLAHSPKLAIEPVITCVGMPNANAYIETNDNTTNPFQAKLRTGGASGLHVGRGATFSVASALVVSLVSVLFL